MTAKAVPVLFLWCPQSVICVDATPDSHNSFGAKLASFQVHDSFGGLHGPEVTRFPA